MTAITVFVLCVLASFIFIRGALREALSVSGSLAVAVGATVVSISLNSIFFFL